MYMHALFYFTRPLKMPQIVKIRLFGFRSPFFGYPGHFQKMIQWFHTTGQLLASRLTRVSSPSIHYNQCHRALKNQQISLLISAYPMQKMLIFELNHDIDLVNAYTKFEHSSLIRRRVLVFQSPGPSNCFYFSFSIQNGDHHVTEIKILIR